MAQGWLEIPQIFATTYQSEDRSFFGKLMALQFTASNFNHSLPSNNIMPLDNVKTFTSPTVFTHFTFTCMKPHSTLLFVLNYLNIMFKIELS